MQKDTYNLTLASLLSGIGKLIKRAELSEEAYENLTLEYLKNNLDNQEVIDILNNSSDKLSTILKIAKKVASSGDETSESLDNISKPLLSIFSRLKNRDEERDYQIIGKVKEDVIPFPKDVGEELLDQEYYRGKVGQINELFNLNLEESYINSVINLLEDITGYIPSNVENQDLQDISLFDSVKITAAVAASINEYLKANPEKEALLFEENPEKILSENALLLFSADFSGIQSFIYTVTTKKALKSLRSRSFFLEFLMEHYIDELLDATQVSRANLLYSGGGHCYILLPNTKEVIKNINDWTNTFNEWLRKQYDIHLYLAIGYTPCSINDLLNLPIEHDTNLKGSYKRMFERVSAEVSENKLHRYTADQIRELNSQNNNNEGRECRICGHVDNLVTIRSEDETYDLCTSCKLFEDISDKVLDKDYFYIETTGDTLRKDFSLPGFNKNINVVITNEQNDIRKDSNIIRIYSKNKYENDYKLNTKLNVGDYIAVDKDNKIIKEMEDYAKKAEGINRIGIARMDVDDLGSAFIAGFEKNNDKEKYVSLIRTSSFSRASTNFFKNFINTILEGTYYDGSKPLKVAIVYSGGDDVFLVGSWDDVIRAAVRLREAFNKYTNGALTISGGIGLYNSKYPIRSASHETEILESASKDYPHNEEVKLKNAITLFTPQEEYTYDWDEFSLNILDEKLESIEKFTEKVNEKHSTFIYNLYTLLKDSKDNPINLARFAYFLARLEPSNKNYQKYYRNFINDMYKWAKNSNGRDKDELLIALLLYIYLKRESNE